ncbi:BQ5605_C002g01714 [Microbotryum silenes-dioicae]|uniref:BQ5605_C002g01714 protein n=1 Tax=Microbotryum silenes-dioicae TaxID=796604 RepID=A0A2X0NWZ7_9BASI|nr:BQ5605_C002g01714 [Microbotryum silenes-dioicae]
MTRVTYFALATVVAATLAASMKLPLCAYPCPESVYKTLSDSYRDGLAQCYDTQKCNVIDKSHANTFQDALCSLGRAAKGQTHASEPSTPVSKKGESKAPGGGQGHEGGSTFNTFSSKKSKEQHEVNKLPQNPERRPSDEKHIANEHPSISQNGTARPSSQTGNSVEHAVQSSLVNATTHPHHSPSSTGHEGQHSKVGDPHEHPLSALEHVQKLTPPETPIPLRKTDKQHQTSGHTSPTHQSPPIENPSSKKRPTEAKPTPKSEQRHNTDKPPSETKKIDALPPTGKMETSSGKETTKAPAQTHENAPAQPGKEKTKAPTQIHKNAPAQTSKKAPVGDGPTTGKNGTGSSDPTKKPVQALPGSSAPQNQSAGSKPRPTSNPAGNSESLQVQTPNNTNGGPGTTGGQSSPSPPPPSRGAPAYILGSWTCLITLGTVIGAAWTMI